MAGTLLAIAKSIPLSNMTTNYFHLENDTANPLLWLLKVNFRAKHVATAVLNDSNGLIVHTIADPSKPAGDMIKEARDYLNLNPSGYPDVDLKAAQEIFALAQIAQENPCWAQAVKTSYNDETKFYPGIQQTWTTAHP